MSGGAPQLGMGMLTPPAHSVSAVILEKNCNLLMTRLKTLETICTGATDEIAEVLRQCLHARLGYSRWGNCAPCKSPSNTQVEDFLGRVKRLAGYLSESFAEACHHVLFPHLHLRPIADVSYPSPSSYR